MRQLLTPFIKRGSTWRSVAIFGVSVGVISGTVAINTSQAIAETPNVPTKVQVITGGNNIAVTWQASDASTTPVKQYEVYRNGSYRATVTPGTGITRAQKTGTTYIDTSVTAGSSYSYQIRAVNTDDEVSSKTTAVSGTQPVSGNTTPLPAVTFRLNGNTDLQPYLNDTVLPDIQTWYPKLADSIARGGYATINDFTISLEMPSNSPIANASASEKLIRVNPDWLRNNKEDANGMFLHEMTHILQGGYTGPNTTKWATEGMADWTREFFARERKPVVQNSNNYLYQGYSQGSALINAGNRWNPNFARNLNIALKNNTFANTFSQPDFVRAQTGRSVSQLWAETGGHSMSDYTDVRGIGGRCIDIPGANTANGNFLKMLDCNDTYQRWTFVYDNGSRKEGILRSDIGDKCLDVDQLHGAVKPGTGVQLWDCNSGIAQKWIAKEDGSLLNPSSGLCLDVQTFNNTPTNNAPIQVWSCNGAYQQKWTQPMFSGSVVNGRGKCADVNGFNPSNGTEIILYGCTGTRAQEWAAIPYKTSTTSFALRSSLGRCLDVGGAATADGSRVYLYDCTGNVAQEWKRGPNDSIINPNANKCLAPVAGANTDGARLELRTCDGSTAQRWPFAPLEIPATVAP